MENRQHLLIYTLWFIMLPCCSFAQQFKWPRNHKTGKVEFSGMLPWPTQVSGLMQRQELVRNWYASKLTDDKPEKRAAAAIEFTDTELSNFAYLDSTSQAQDKWRARSIRLLYQVQLTYTPEGLIYKLSDFECAEIISDASNSASLEEVLRDGRSKELPKLAAFYKRLSSALSSW